MVSRLGSEKPGRHKPSTCFSEWIRFPGYAGVSLTGILPVLGLVDLSCFVLRGARALFGLYTLGKLQQYEFPLTDNRLIIRGMASKFCRVNLMSDRY